MPKKKSKKDNPNGWGYTEKRKILTSHQLSPRIQITKGDLIKIGKGPYYLNNEGQKISVGRMSGQWKIKGIFQNNNGDVELDLVELVMNGLYGACSSIRISGKEYPSKMVSSITNRPYKVRLANPKKRRKIKKNINPKRQNEEVNWENLASIVKKSTLNS